MLHGSDNLHYLSWTFYLAGCGGEVGQDLGPAHHGPAQPPATHTQRLGKVSKVPFVSSAALLQAGKCWHPGIPSGPATEGSWLVSKTEGREREAAAGSRMNGPGHMQLAANS